MRFESKTNSSSLVPSKWWIVISKNEDIREEKLSKKKYIREQVEEGK